MRGKWKEEKEKTLGKGGNKHFSKGRGKRNKLQGRNKKKN